MLLIRSKVSDPSPRKVVIARFIGRPSNRLDVATDADTLGLFMFFSSIVLAVVANRA